jgi:hypothetical protein
MFSFLWLIPPLRNHRWCAHNFCSFKNATNDGEHSGHRATNFLSEEPNRTAITRIRLKLQSGGDPNPITIETVTGWVVVSIKEDWNTIFPSKP